MDSGAGEGMTAQRTGETEITLRKEHHLDICLDDQRYPDPAPIGTSLEQVQFVHQAVPELDSARVDTTQPFLHAMLRLPLMISCMTGGSGRGRSANRALAAAAQRAGIAIGIGSIRPLLQDEATFGDFHVKPLAPDVPVLANLGAVQLRDLRTHTLRQMLQRLEVQALVVHLNAGQELFQPDGDRDFRGLLDAIERVTAECGMPVIVKETGFGIRPGLVRYLLGCGVRYVDLAGADGTNWVMVEGRRLPHSQRASADAFADWGLPTGVLLALLRDLAGNLIASGGLRHGVHLAKAMAMGAACGAMALPFIRAVMAGGSDGALALIHRIEHELRTVMDVVRCNIVGRTAPGALAPIGILPAPGGRTQARRLGALGVPPANAEYGSGSDSITKTGERRHCLSNTNPAGCLADLRTDHSTTYLNSYATLCATPTCCVESRTPSKTSRSCQRRRSRSSWPAWSASLPATKRQRPSPESFILCCPPQPSQANRIWLPTRPGSSASRTSSTGFSSTPSNAACPS